MYNIYGKLTTNLHLKFTKKIWTTNITSKYVGIDTKLIFIIKNTF